MILRIVLGRLPSGTDAAALLELRGRLARAAREVNGLDSLIVGARRARRGDDGDLPVEAAIVTVWRDAESIARATGNDEQDRFLGNLLRLPIVIDRADHYEIVARTFAALPPETTAYLRIVTVRARPNEEARLLETLRDRHPQLVEMGLVASHLGRRVVGHECEAVTVGVWPDRPRSGRPPGAVPSGRCSSGNSRTGRTRSTSKPMTGSRSQRGCRPPAARRSSSSTTTCASST